MAKQLTDKQQQLADLFISTKTQAKVRRRKQNPDGTYEFYTTVRDTSPIDFPVNEEEFAIKVHEENPAAPLSPIYVNLRSLPETLITEIANVLSEVDLGEKVDYCTGIPATALAFAKAYSDVTKVPFIDVFDKVESGGSREIVAKPDAKSGKGKKLVIIDDVISHGNSKFEALKAAESLGYTISFLVLIDRSQGGVAKLEQMGYKTHIALTILDLLEYYKQSNKISQEKYDQAMRYFTNK